MVAVVYKHRILSTVENFVRSFQGLLTLLLLAQQQDHLRHPLVSTIAFTTTTTSPPISLPCIIILVSKSSSIVTVSQRNLSLCSLFSFLIWVGTNYYNLALDSI